MSRVLHFLLLITFCLLLTSCGGDSNSSTASLLGSLKATKASSSTITLTTAQQYDIIRLMQAMFNAAPGAFNLQVLGEHLVSSGISMSELAKELEQSDLFKSPLLYPPSLTSQQFADKLVTNMIGDTANAYNRASIASAVAYFVDNGTSRGEIAWLLASLISTIPVTDSNWGKAAAQLSNRVEVAYYYSVTKAQSSDDFGTLQAVTRFVTADPATVITAKATTPVNLAPSWAYAGVTSGNRQITLNWTSASKTSTTGTYTLYWSKTPGVTKKTGFKISNVKSPYIHTGLSNGTSYYYVLTETVAGIEGAESLEVATAPKGMVPQAPAGITISPLNNAILLTIDRTGVAATTKYNLYWSASDKLTNATKISNAFGSTTTFRHNGLTNGTIYYYAVAAESTEGEGAKSSIMAATPLADISATNYVAGSSSAKPAAPKSVSAVAASQQVAISWDMPKNQLPTVFDPAETPTQAPVISAYNIYWATSLITDLKKANKLTLTVSKEVTLPVTFVHNTGLTNNTPYYYSITAVAATDVDGNPLKNAAGTVLSFESPTSSQVMAVPEAKKPAAPTGLSATSGAQQIALSWTASSTSGAVYRLYVSDKVPASPEELVASQNLVAITTTPSYTHTALQSGITYYYVVTAVTDAESAPTAAVAIALR